MISTILLAAVIAAPPPPAAAPGQFSCAMIGVGDTQPTRFDLDLTAKKKPNAVLRFAGVTPYLRTSATSVATAREDGSRTIAFSTGNGRFRLELTPQGDVQRLRLAAMEEAGGRPTLGQGYCTARAGKRLPDTKPTLLPPDTATPPRPWKLQPLTQRLPDFACNLVTPAGELRRIDYQVASAGGNEWSLRYTATAADLLGQTNATGSGTRFLLAVPGERIVSTMALVAGTPSTFVHITFERQGNFVDVTRGGQIVAVGVCGSPLGWLAAGATPPTATRTEPTRP